MPDNTMLKFSEYIQDKGKWYNIVENEDVPELYIYDAIGSSMWDSGVVPKDFVKELKNLEKKYEKVNIRINSPGGFVHDAFAIYTRLEQSPLAIDVYIDGLAASSASYIAMAGDNIFMSDTSDIMIHDPWTLMAGGSADLRKEADLLDAVKSKIMKIYRNKTNLSIEKLDKMMSDETWLDAEEAVKLGFATEIMEGSKAAACGGFDLSMFNFNNTPEKVKKLQNALQKRQKEKDLRDAGKSKNDAKKELSEKYRQERDALFSSEAHKYFAEKINSIITGG